MTRSRWLALAAVCALSVGSHFSAYLLGPLKSRLHREMGTSNSQFSLLVASFNLNSTWTPLVAGIFVARFGTALSSVATTGCVLVGQLILLLGVTIEHLNIMTLGLFVFGLGMTPLAVVQETLLSHLSPSHNLGISLALGLVSGKSSSFISSLVSLPLAKKFGDWMPFTLAVILCSVSFLGNALRLLFGWGSEAGEAAVKAKRRVSWGGVGSLGDVFWVYILLNVLAGAIWQPFLHLSANLVQHRYNLTESIASFQASILLAGAIVLYPLVGILTDRLGTSTPRVTFHCIHLSSLFTLLGYTYLLLPPSLTGSPWFGMILFAMGHGMATLLMVIVVPRLLPPALVPLGLGLHKSLEMASSSLSQTLSGLWLDHARGADEEEAEYQAGSSLLRVYWTINILQFICALFLWRLERKKRREGGVEIAEEYEQLPSSDPVEEGSEGEEQEGRVNKVPLIRVDGPSSALVHSEGERRRARWGFGASLGFIGVVWLVFMTTAWSRL
ncbi:hypothetical protein TREMEDRAFT_69096 [Tremella mesenterica DSM 1558]|uniref:uncharacterized protein n=1 Tax=Tremella mesenterica (strain ATCC 24925 / CBS 8224 / DSM 1558 / NBRC 9311 / NRRL Y-6157 / RJB 2259-6 / UBC 559-6) TaxID=578456 RepID=UPI0003F49984|nr:uncharacterized protein TREMEDRAFT_69096 [Tremella mesenterica DSM 1558]EIW68617.1 hypothetical protein TREMEDRAFT_69096 [Tremella mesenterica DSM 1558]